MKLSSELINAILSMDSYSRGYDAALQLDGNEIGDVKIAHLKYTTLRRYVLWVLYWLLNINEKVTWGVAA